MIDKDIVCKILLIIVFVIVIIQIIKIFTIRNVITDVVMMNQQPSVEGMGPVSPDNRQLPYPENYETNPNFFLKDNIYDSEKKFNPTLVSPIPNQPGLSCAPKFDWDVLQNPGANNTYMDIAWQYRSPSTIVTDNCINCKNYMSNKQFNSPEGIESNYTNSLSGTLIEGALKDDALPSGNRVSNMSLCNRDLSPGMSTGIHDIDAGKCLNDRMASLNKCGCATCPK